MWSLFPKAYYVKEVSILPLLWISFVVVMYAVYVTAIQEGQNLAGVELVIQGFVIRTTER